MSTPIEHPLSGADFIRQFFPTSPYVTHLGMQLTNIQPGMAIIRNRPSFPLEYFKATDAIFPVPLLILDLSQVLFLLRPR